MILVDATLDVASQRASNLREEVRNMQLHQQGGTLEGITVSIGVAAFPDHGTSSAEILSAADKALYAAKANGRDRVAIAPAGEKASGAAESR